MSKIIANTYRHSGASADAITLDSSGNVTFNGTVTGDNNTVYDDSNLRKDLLNLALQTAVDTNRKSYNLQNSFVDQFEDDTGIGTETNVDRNASEYVSPQGDNGSQTQVAQNAGTIIGDFDTRTSAAFDEDTTKTNSESANKSTSTGNVAWLGKNWGTEKYISGFKVWATSNDGLHAGGGSSSGCTLTLYGNSTNNTATAVNLGGLTGLNFRTDTQYEKKSGLTVTTAYQYHWLKWGSLSNDATSLCAELQFFEDPININATGTIISTANTASSSRTKVSGVVLYKDSAGTATIGTDFKIYFTCNGGTNWTEVTSRSTGSDFSTGVKTLYLNETTCTAGTDVRYKIEWANQSVSKVTQLHGIGVNY